MKPIQGALALSTALALTCLEARAQTFYVDCTPGDGETPSAAYGGPRGLPGVWNSLPLDNDGFPLVDVNGAATGVLAVVDVGCDAGSCDAPEIEGDDAALLEDWWNGDCYASPNTIRLYGLAEGLYQITIIGYGSCNTDSTTSVRVQLGGLTVATVDSGGVPFLGDWVDFPLGTTTFELAAGQWVHLTQWSFPYPGGLAGFQLVRLGEDPTPYCFGTLGGCPCEPGAPGHGCPSSFDADGALLVGSGRAKLDADTVVLSASGVGNGVVTFIQGDAILGQGLGIPFGDGLRCTGGQVVRLASKLASGGVAIYPEAGDLPISEKGLIPPTGGTRGYQVWYRNPQSYCTEATFNLTNGVALHWH